MFLEYIYIYKFFLFCILVSLILFCISFFFVYQNPEIEKLSSYECGFNAFGDARNKFEIRFFLVGVLFIIFDLEISFLFPWLICVNQISMMGIIVMLLFIIILTIGLFMNDLMEH